MAMPTTFLPMNKLLAKVLHLKLILKPIDLLSLGRLNRLMNFFKISYSVKPYGPPTITLASFGGNVLFVYLSLGFLKYITFHDEYQQVPDLKGIPLINLPQIAADKNLRYEIIDSSKFTPNLTTAKRYRALSPAPDDSVKKNRKIYTSHLNPSGYRRISVPDVVQITRRNAEVTLMSVGFTIGEISYRNDIGKDMVLEMRYRGAPPRGGNTTTKNSRDRFGIGQWEEETRVTRLMEPHLPTMQEYEHYAFDADSGTRAPTGRQVPDESHRECHTK